MLQSEVTLNEIQVLLSKYLETIPTIPGDAINYGDLSCVEVRSWVNNYGETGITTYVEEASADAIQLQKLCREHLKSLNYVVDVETSW